MSLSRSVFLCFIYFSNILINDFFLIGFKITSSKIVGEISVESIDDVAIIGIIISFFLNSIHVLLPSILGIQISKNIISNMNTNTQIDRKRGSTSSYAAFMHTRAAAQDAVLYNPAPVCKPNHQVAGKDGRWEFEEDSRLRLRASQCRRAVVFECFTDVMKSQGNELWGHVSCRLSFYGDWCMKRLLRLLTNARE